MNKKSYYLVILFSMHIILSSLHGKTWEDNHATFYGTTTLKNNSYSTLNLCGTTTAQKITATECKCNGTTTMTDSQIKDIICKGVAHITGTKIEILDFSGKLFISHSSVQELIAAGQIELKETTVSKKCVLTSRNVIIKDSTINTSITILRCNDTSNENDFFIVRFFRNLFSSSKPKEQILKIQGTTIVTGDIVFKDCTGKVYIDKTATVKGKVIGAEIIKA